MDKAPKYAFGLLETPSSSSMSNSGVGSASVFGPVKNCSSTGPYRGSSSSSVRARPYQTPGTGASSVRSTTPGSRHLPTNMTPRDNTAVIVAVVEGRGLAKGTVGLSSIDLKQPVLTLSQFTDSSTYIRMMTKLQILQPIEIIVPHTACENGSMTEMFKLISEHFHNTNIATVQKKYFNENSGIQYIKHLCLPEYNTVEMEIRNKYYCLASTAALIKYVGFIQNVVYAPSSLKIVFKGIEQTTMIDEATIRNLELLQNSQDLRSSHNLYGMLNHTKTPMGNRLLKVNVVQPPCDMETINIRLDAVTELTQKGTMFYSIQAAISRFLDLDHLLSLCVQIPKHESVKVAESKITNILHLKHSLELVEPLHDTLGEGENALFKAYYQTLVDPRFKILQEKIEQVIHDDARIQKGALNMRTQKCFAVKPNINGLLDVSRRTYTEIVDDIAELVGNLSEQYSLPLKTGYSAGRGFFIQLYTGAKEQHTQESLPGIFIKITKQKNMLGFTTTELVKLNDRINESLQEIYIMTNVVVSELMKELREHFGCLYKLTECVAMLDMLTAFAHNCTLSEYVRPLFTDTLAIKQGRHPILDKISLEQPVPNNVYASDENNFVVITGPNMSGKSTYLRQIALLQVLAQMGSFIPAEAGSFRICDQIFSRIGSDDDILTNSSTFMLEMREINYIVQNASRNSLIIIDELGRGTSADEGVGICHSICEYLLNVKAFTFFATHFMELTNLDSLYPNVENYHFEIHQAYNNRAGKDKITYTHVLSKGKTAEKHYGLQLAELTTLPSSLLDHAKQLADTISEQLMRSHTVTEEAIKNRAVFKLGTRLSQTALNSRLDVDSLRTYLKTLRDQYTADIHQAGAGEE